MERVMNVENLAKDFESKLNRNLRENEVEFIKWMIKTVTRQSHLSHHTNN
ncbi:hypothetical protein ACFFHM_24090 [Halalkalibacter kiskunsagensis]|uniref:Uncharacterized protein n=1 Tax=Halalkalibacter kiskunsagensis TaxID=1548599 RepID=A0ABV6KNW9_9BACI